MIRQPIDSFFSNFQTTGQVEAVVILEDDEAVSATYDEHDVRLLPLLQLDMTTKILPSK